MKYILILIASILLSNIVIAQSKDCWTIEIKKTDFDNSVTLSEQYNFNGIYLVKNGIYNFKIDGIKYPMYRISKIMKDSLEIVFGVDDEPKLKFSLVEIEKLYFYSLNDGVSGIPTVFKPGKYKFKTIQSRKYCEVPKAKIYSGKDKKDFVEGYQYMTAGYGWKPVYKEEGQTFLLDNKVIHEIKKQ